MDAAERTGPVSRLERSSHTAFLEERALYVWGGHQVSDVAMQLTCAFVCVSNPPLPGSHLQLCA